MSAYIIEKDPKTYKEHMQSVDAPLWKEVINSVLDLILSNHTSVLTHLPWSCKHLGCKRVFKKKLKADESIDKYNAHWCLKGLIKEKNLITLTHILLLLK